MFERLYYFDSTTMRWAVALPFELEEWIGEWARLRQAMLRTVPSPFTRDEWAYLLAFLDAENLRLPFELSFGQPTSASHGPVQRLARPRGPIAMWLPNNVSLLGPLMLILASLTGSLLRLKVGSHAEDLSAAFVDFARQALSAGPLRTYLLENVRLERLERADPRHQELAAEAAVRIIFGSDEAVAAINALSHPVDSVAYAFSDRQSEVWLEPDCANDENLATLIKVFAIYGQAGCTSPKRVVLLGGTVAQAREVRDGLIELWPQIMTRDVPMHIASENIMARQWAAAVGWDAALASRQGAVFAFGGPDLPRVEGAMVLPIVPAGLEQAAKQLPANIQTVGYAVHNPQEPRWLDAVARTSIKRFVPLGRMHHFGPVWDGFGFWRGLWEEVEVGT